MQAKCENTDLSSPDPAKKKNKMKRNSTETSLSHSPQDSAKKHKKAKEQKGTRSWEQAVKKVRGLPDGAENGKDAKKVTSTPSSTKKKQFEKKKKGPFNVLQNASKKLKTLKGKGDADKQKKAVKRKTESGEESKGDGKAAKIEELTFRERKKQRKTQKVNYDLALRAKKIWEQLRKHNITAEKKKELCDELYSIVEGKAKELIFAHDTSRVIQCLMKYGQNEHRSALFEELKDDIVEMAKSKYSKFFVRKLLKYGMPSQRAYVFKGMYGHVRQLIRHNLAAELVEDAYNNYANAQQRSSLIEEFYGPSFALFKEPHIQTLDQIIESQPEKRVSILSNMKETLSSLVDKSTCQYSIVHRVFYEYFTYATEKARSEMIEIVRENIIHMLHTRDGTRVAMQCLWYGTAKDRKLIIKSMKTFVIKICMEEYGHLVLLAMFDCVDDTKLVQKAIIDEMLRSVSDVVQDKYGRKVLMYLLSPRNRVHCHPEITKILQQGDNNPTSKKDVKTRQAELLGAVSGPLLRYIENNAKELVMNNATVLLLIAVLAHAKGDLSKAMTAVAKIAAEPFVAGNLENYHMVEHPTGHLALKQLLIQDKERRTQQDAAFFSHILLDQVSDSNLKAWANCNRGCFTLTMLLDQEDPVVSSRVNKVLVTVEKSLQKSSSKGAEILAKKRQSLS